MNLSLKIKNDNGTENTITVDSMTHAQTMNYGVTTLGGDVHTQRLGDSLNYGVNWLNAIRHSEVNSETKIHWLTFYNTNFTFNVNNVGLDADYCFCPIQLLHCKQHVHSNSTGR